MNLFKQIEQILEETVDKQDKRWNVNEIVNIIDQKWRSVPLIKLSEKQLQRLFEIYESSYRYVGLHPQIQNPNEIITSRKYHNALLIDLNRNNKPDAFIIYKTTNIGNKLTLFGADSNIPGAKSKAVSKIVDLFGKNGWYGETNTKSKPYSVFKKNNVNMINNSDKIKQILTSLEIPLETVKMYDDGTYERTIGGSLVSREQIFGHPNLNVNESIDNRQDTHEKTWEDTKKRNRKWINVLKTGGTPTGPAYPEKVKTSGHISAPPMEEDNHQFTSIPSECAWCGGEFDENESGYDEFCCDDCEEEYERQILGFDDDEEELEEMSGAGGAGASIQGAPNTKRKDMQTLIREEVKQMMRNK
jgi:hypothetical protein